MQLSEILPVNAEFGKLSLHLTVVLQRRYHGTHGDIFDAVLLTKCSEEELQSLKDAMQNVLMYWSTRIACISKQLQLQDILAVMYSMLVA